MVVLPNLLSQYGLLPFAAPYQRITLEYNSFVVNDKGAFNHCFSVSL